MLEQEMVRRNFGSVDGRSAGLVDGGGEFSLLLAVQEEARVVLTLAQEDAAMEAQDVLSQADEALVLG